MKHQWEADEHGEIKPADEDSQHPVAACRICGGLSSCLYAQDTRSTCWMTGHDLDADDCPGLDLTVAVEVTIRHPGTANCWDDRTSVTRRFSYALTQVLDAVADPVDLDLGHLRAVMVEKWKATKEAHRTDWERVIAAHSNAEEPR